MALFDMKQFPPVAAAFASLLSVFALIMNNKTNDDLNRAKAEIDRMSREDTNRKFLADAGVQYANLLGAGDTNQIKKMAGIMFFRTLRTGEQEPILRALSEADPDLASLALYRVWAAVSGVTNLESTIVKSEVKAANLPIRNDTETPILSTTNESKVAAIEILRDNTNAASGWLYIGTHNGYGWTNQTIELGRDSTDKIKGSSRRVVNDVYLRTGKPIRVGGFYSLAGVDAVRVLVNDEIVRIEEVENMGSNRFWAHVSVTSTNDDSSGK